MSEEINEWQTALKTCLDTILSRKKLNHHDIFVVGASTSEIVGQHIGSAGSEEAAAAIYEEIDIFQQKTGVHLAFQGCEHINRSLVVERETARMFQLDEVTVVPHRKAGGAMATYAFHQFSEPVIIENIKADAGIDIGDTLIGMHLKPVAIPVRGELTEIGNAHVTMAVTRPKLIGGSRAIYPNS